MDKITTMPPTTIEETELQNAIREIFREMEQTDVRIRRNHEEIDKLKSETRAILSTLRKV